MTLSNTTWLVFTCDVTHLKRSWEVRQLDLHYIHMWHGSCHTCNIPHTYYCNSCICDVTLSYVTWLISKDLGRYSNSIYTTSTFVMSHATHVTYLVHTWRNSCVCHATLSYVTCLISKWLELKWLSRYGDPIYTTSTCDMSHATYVTYLIHMWCNSCIYEVTLSYVTWLISKGLGR